MSDATERLKAALADRYAIEREIGSGGMATVYLADDLKHRRKVALKVLRPELAATMGPERFLHEIEIAAQLQHPHILPLHDSGEAAGFLYYVMPYVEGQTLRDRLLREGELPIASAVRILIEVTDALVEAHKRGLVHRDIKPENVLFAGRHAVVTDFGVAKAVNEAASRYKATTAGVALGTPDYMAPEQATADPKLDHRVDIYAVGAMAYEMLTGRAPFGGSTAAAVLAAHLTQTPKPIAGQRPGIPPALEAIVLRCLAKPPDERFQSAEELLAALEPLATTQSGGVTPTDTRPMPTARGSRRVLVVGGIAGVVVTVIAAALWRGRDGMLLEFGPVKTVTTDPGLELQPALSPDGKLVAYVAGSARRLRLFVRSVSGGTPVELAKDLPDSQEAPAFSPDGTRILFDAGGSIYVVAQLGGVPTLVVQGGPSEQFAQPVWSPDGRQLAYVGNFRELYVRSLSGGEPRRVTTALGLHSPAWSLDGRLIAYVVDNQRFGRGGGALGDLGPAAIMIVPAGGGEPVRVSNRDFQRSHPTWLPDSRHLLFMSTQDGGRDLYVVPIDRSGTPSAIPSRLTTGLDVGTLAHSADGKWLAYSAFQNTANIWSVAIPASGSVSGAEARPVTRGTQHIEYMDVSPDGRWVAFDSDRNGNPHIYKMPLAGGEPQQLTFDTAYNFIPRWSPDGHEIAFQSPRGEGVSRSVYVVPARGGAAKYVALGNSVSWSPDGRQLVSGVTLELGILLVSRDSAGHWGEARRLSDSGEGPRWSPLGREILHGRPNEWLRVISPEGVLLREVLNARNSAPGRRVFCCWVWSPDGRTIYFTADAGSDDPYTFWAIPGQGGVPRLLVYFDSAGIRPARHAFATDGKQIYFIVAEHQSDIKVMEVRPKR